ncbi:MAG: hypothetical protein LBS69_02640, partial [Prevotellaceae bacterium]|nr:hypothetical protein [Prevotellaceae bacterium]
MKLNKKIAGFLQYPVQNPNLKPNRFRKPVRFDDACCPVRDRILVERNADTCMSRELPTVFHVIGSASRENI